MTITDRRLAITRTPRVRPGDVTAHQRSLPLDGNLALTSPSSPMPRRPALELVRAQDDAPAEDDITVRSRRIVQALVEVVLGDRPVGQLARWTSTAVYDDLVMRLDVLARVRSTRGPVRATRAKVASVRVFQPREDSAEVSARIVGGRRSRALALRLDVVENARGQAHWSCTAVAWG